MSIFWCGCHLPGVCMLCKYFGVVVFWLVCILCSILMWLSSDWCYIFYADCQLVFFCFVYIHCVPLTIFLHQVYLSVNEGTYVISRLHNGSTPTDVLLSRFLSGVLPPSLAIRLKAYISTRSINPRTSGLGPKPYIPWKRRAFVINDILPCKV